MIDSVTIWRQRIEEAKKWHGKVLDKTNPYARAYNGEFPSMMMGRYSESLSMNYVYKVTQIAQANLLYSAPAYQLPPIGPDEYEYSAMVASFTNRVVRETGIETEAKYALKDALIRGSGYLKIGYHEEDSPTKDQIEPDGERLVDLEIESFLQNKPVPKPNVEQDQEMHIRAIDAAIMGQPEVMMEMIRQHGMVSLLRVVQHQEERRKLAERKQKLGRTSYRVKPNEIWLRYVDFRDILIDGNATRWEDARWFAIRTVHNIKGLKRSQVYKLTSKLEGTVVEPHGGHKVSDGDTESQLTAERLAQGIAPKKGRRKSAGAEVDPDDMNVEMWEIWDKATGMVLAICDQVDDFLRSEISPYSDLPNFFPVARMCFNEQIGVGDDDHLRPYGYSWIAPWWEQQLELNKFISIRHDIAKRSTPRFVAAANVSKKFLERLARAEPGAITQLKDSGASGITPANAVSAIQVPQVTMDIHQTILTLQDQIAFISGFSEIQLTGQSSARTATASALQAQAQSAFAEGILRSIEKTMTEVARIIMAIAREYYDEARIVKIEGPQAGPKWQAFKDADLYGDLVEVIPGSTKPQVDALKRAQWGEVLGLLSKVGAPPEGQKLALFELLRAMGVTYPEIFFPAGATMNPNQGQGQAPEGQMPTSQGEVAGQASNAMPDGTSQLAPQDTV